MSDKLIASFPKMSGQQRAEVRKKAENWLATGSPKQRADAEQVLEALDLHERKAAEELAEHVRRLPKEQRIIEAFEVEPLTQAEALVVQVLLDNPGLTSEALSEKAGWKAQTWHLHFGMMCEGRKERLGPAPKLETDSTPFYSGILADFDTVARSWTMRPEAVEAFTALGLRPRVRHEPA